MTAATSLRRLRTASLTPHLGALAFTLTTLLFLALTATQALALETHVFKESFASPGSGAGQLDLQAASSEGEGVGGSGVAVNATTGDVYVADTGNDRVDEFESDGTFLRAWGWGVGDGLSPELQECTITCFKGLSGSGAGEFESPVFIAVDNSGGPSEGDVYVGDATDNLVSKFSEDGTLETTWGNGGQLSGPFATGTGTLTAESTTITGVVTSTGAFAPGEEIEGAGIPAGTSITASPGGGVLEISNPVEAGKSGAAVALTAHRSFAPLGGIAVDASGNLDVLQVPEPHIIFRFEQDATFTGGEFPTERSAGAYGLAVNGAGDLFKVLAGAGGVQEATGTGANVGTVREHGVGGAGPTQDVAGAGNNLYALEPGAVAHYAFADPLVEPAVVTEPGGSTCTIGEGSPCPASDSFGSGHITEAAGMAVNSADGAVYVTDAGTGEIERFAGPVTLPDVSTGSAKTVKGHAATLTGTVNPDGIALTECRFEYVPATEYEEKAPNPYAKGASVPCAEGLGEEAGEIGKGTEPVAVEAEAAGLSPNTEYDFRLVIANANGPNTGADEKFSTAPPPEITAAEVSNLSKESADLSVQVNPGGIPLESCAFEYGTEAGVYPHKLECTPAMLAQIGSGTTPVAISQHVEKLEPDITYHWRVVASSEAGTTTGADHTFRYDTESSASLPDGRSYEMVTPPLKNGALLGNVPLQKPVGIAGDGSRVIMSAVQCFDASPSCLPVGRKGIGVPYQFSRTAAGWATESLAPPLARFSADTWWASNPDTNTSVFSMPTAPGGEDDFYGRDPEGGFSDIGPLSPPSGRPVTPEEFLETTLYTGSADLSHFVFLALPFWPYSVTLQGNLQEHNSLFQYPNGGRREPALVGVSGPLGNIELISECDTRLPNEGGGFATPESADGRIVYFDAEACSSGSGANNAGIPVPVSQELFARVDGGEAGAETVAISEPDAPQVHDEPNDECTGECAVNTVSPTKPAEEPPNPNWRTAQFRGTSSDGSKTFFESAQQLTNAATEDSNNLYLYDMKAAEGHRWVDASAGENGLPAVGGPRVQGVLAQSNDGSHVYFVAQGILTKTPNAEGGHAVEGAENLYVFDAATGSTSFIGDLQPGGRGVGDAREWETPGEPANVTPDGRFLVFTSRAALTGDVTRTDGAEQVYRYDAATGVLQRVSVGERGFNDNGNAGAGDAFIVPAVYGEDRLGEGRADPTMADDGSRVFFMSPLALTPKALNDVPLGAEPEGGGTGYVQNVYEWEQEGVGSCPAGGGACVYLLSDGHDTSVLQGEACLPNISTVCLLGSDTTGRNVFFTTADQLLKRDTDTQLDVYDARVCEPEHGNPCVTEPAGALPPCLGESCHGTPPAAPSTLTPGSATFNGAPNATPPAPPPSKPKSLTRAQKLAKALKACRTKHNKHKRHVCEKQARKRYGAKSSAHKSSRATNNRRAGR